MGGLSSTLAAVLLALALILPAALAGLGQRGMAAPLLAAPIFFLAGRELRRLFRGEGLAPAWWLSIAQVVLGAFLLGGAIHVLMPGSLTGHQGRLASALLWGLALSAGDLALLPAGEALAAMRGRGGTGPAYGAGPAYDAGARRAALGRAQASLALGLCALAAPWLVPHLDSPAAWRAGRDLAVALACGAACGAACTAVFARSRSESRGAWIALSSSAAAAATAGALGSPAGGFAAALAAGLAAGLIGSLLSEGSRARASTSQDLLPEDTRSSRLAAPAPSAGAAIADQWVYLVSGLAALAWAAGEMASATLGAAAIAEPAAPFAAGGELAKGLRGGLLLWAMALLVRLLVQLGFGGLWRWFRPRDLPALWLPALAWASPPGAAAGALLLASSGEARTALDALPAAPLWAVAAAILVQGTTRALVLSRAGAPAAPREVKDSWHRMLALSVALAGERRAVEDLVHRGEVDDEAAASMLQAIDAGERRIEAALAETAGSQPALRAERLGAAVRAVLAGGRNAVAEARERGWLDAPAAERVERELSDRWSRAGSATLTELLGDLDSPPPRQPAPAAQRPEGGPPSPFKLG